MADIFQTGVQGGTGAKDLTVADHSNAFGPGTSTDYATGDLRRKYNFGERVSELAIAQDPFFRFVSKVSKKSTDDPAFKWAEKRPSWNKRYAYVIGYDKASASEVTGDATLLAYNDDSAPGAGDTIKVYMAGDYKTEGNVQNIFGNTTNKIDVGVSGTTPNFFLPGQLVKVPMMTDGGTDASTWGTDYILAKVTAVGGEQTVDAKVCVAVTAEVVKASSVAGLAGWNVNAFSPGITADDEAVSDISIENLEKARTYVVGTAHAEGSGYPETWKDQPYSTNHGLTQIWKTSCAMTNTARATSLKYDSSEWSRVWQEKLIEHKYDIETSLLFGTQYIDTSGDIQYTQGAVDYISNFGNQFSMDISTKTADDFLDDMSNYLDPRYNNSKGTVFFVSTAVYNWMHKLGGYFKNNLEVSANFRADFAMSDKKKVLGIDITTFSTPYGDMNVARNIHLDQTQVKMLGINLSNCKYRPLVGNGINRDTSVYVGVQTLENSGIDRRVDLILTEAGMEWQMPESHAIWN
tara:strand:- start:3147 stop:4706 length:1560 start_codon:yes stop_codon:yes gene_type:complete